jgi:hypothetical protein
MSVSIEPSASFWRPFQTRNNLFPAAIPEIAFVPKPQFGLRPTPSGGDTLELTKLPGNWYGVPISTTLNWDYATTMNRLKQLVGDDTFQAILDPSRTVESPIANKADSSWLKQTKIVGITPRVLINDAKVAQGGHQTGTYLDIVRAAMTTPDEAVHLLPIYDIAGPQRSLYSPSSWRLSDEFLDRDLQRAGLVTPEQQVRFVVKALHGLGKAVGFDAIQHVNRHAELVFIHPEWFPWIKLDLQ